MDYDEDLLVELIAGGDLSQTEIAEKVGVSRRTVWRIANGHSRPDLQTKIADTVEGIRQATIRMAAKWMKSLLHKEIKVALEGDGETARKCREFLLKTFMIVLPEQAAKAPAKKCDPAPDPDRQLDGIALYNSLVELSPDLKDQVVKELGGPPEDSAGVYEGKEEAGDERLSATDSTACPEQGRRDDTDAENVTVSPSPTTNCPLPTATPSNSDPEGKEGKKKPFDPFAEYVDGPNGTKIHAETIRIIEEAEAEAAKIKPRRRVKRGPQ